MLQQITIKLRIYGIFWTIRLTAQYLYRKVFYEYLQSSYSQYNEDLIIAKLLNKRKIFYIDIGANHPRKFNNTYRFYLQGSRGINIEPNSHLIKLYNILRPHDKNLNIAIASKNAKMLFYDLYPDVISTLSKAKFKHSLQNGAVLKSIQKIKTTTLKDIFGYYTSSQPVDLLSIDTEGYDLLVLQSNDWTHHRPRLICVETIENNGVDSYLNSQKYQKIYQNEINSIYQDIL